MAYAEEGAHQAGIEEGKRILAHEIAKDHNRAEKGGASKRASASSPATGVALAVSQRGRVRVRIVEDGHHLLLHSPAGYKNKARATKILERIQQARLLRVEDFEMVEEEDK